MEGSGGSGGGPHRDAAIAGSKRVAPRDTEGGKNQGQVGASSAMAKGMRRKLGGALNYGPPSVAVLPPGSSGRATASSGLGTPSSPQIPTSKERSLVQREDHGSTDKSLGAIPHQRTYESLGAIPLVGEGSDQMSEEHLAFLFLKLNHDFLDVVEMVQECRDHKEAESFPPVSASWGTKEVSRWVEDDGAFSALKALFGCRPEGYPQASMCLRWMVEKGIVKRTHLRQIFKRMGWSYEMQDDTGKLAVRLEALVEAHCKGLANEVHVPSHAPVLPHCPKRQREGDDTGNKRRRDGDGDEDVFPGSRVTLLGDSVVSSKTGQGSGSIDRDDEAIERSRRRKVRVAAEIAAGSQNVESAGSASNVADVASTQETRVMPSATDVRAYISHMGQSAIDACAVLSRLSLSSSRRSAAASNFLETQGSAMNIQAAGVQSSLVDGPPQGWRTRVEGEVPSPEKAPVRMLSHGADEHNIAQAPLLVQSCAIPTSSKAEQAPLMNSGSHASLQSQDSPRNVMDENEDCTREGVDCPPHPDIVTSFSDYDRRDTENGRKSLPFAIAEKIDNAISATMGNTGPRKIDVYFLYDSNDELQNIAIRDNGKGMSKEESKAYATFGYSQKSRKQDGLLHESRSLPWTTGSRFSIDGEIGHFGVGGQNSTFFLGYVEHVMTCPSSAAKRSKNPVTDFIMDKEKMLENKEEAYKYIFESRKPGDNHLIGLEIPQEDHPILKRLASKDEEEDFERGGFSLFVISRLRNGPYGPKAMLRPPGPMKRDYQQIYNCGQGFSRGQTPNILQELARTFHFYLHGIQGDERLPANLEEHDEEVEVDDEEEDGNGGKKGAGKRSKKSTVDASTGAGRKKARGGDSDSEQRDVISTIKVHVYKQDELMALIPLHEVCTVETVLMQKKVEDVKEIFMTVVPTASNARPCRISLFLYYCPFNLENETRPYDKHETTDNSPPHAVLSCFWQGRWIPFKGITDDATMDINHLNIFPQEGDERELLKRVRGVVMLPRGGVTVKSTKMDFSELPLPLMNKHDTVYHQFWSDEHPIVGNQRTVSRKVKEWLKNCHDKYDRELVVQDIVQGDFLDPANGRPETRFRKLVYGVKTANAKNDIFLTGTKFRLIKGQHKTGCCEIVYFACEKLGDGRTVTGRADIAYRRHPRELYGRQTGEEVLLRCKVDRKLLTNSKLVDVHLWEKQHKILLSQLPAKVYVVAESEDRSSSLSMKPQSLARHENQMLKSMWSKETIRTGYLLPELFVIVVNASGDPLTELLDPGGKSNYKIKILRRVTQIKDHAERMARGGVGSIPPKVLTSLDSQNKAGSTTECGKGHEKFYAAHFPAIKGCFGCAGEYEVSFSICDCPPEYKDIKWHETLRVEPSDPTYAHLEETEDGKKMRLGVKSSAVKLSFHDPYQNDTQLKNFVYKGNIVCDVNWGCVRVKAIDVQPKTIDIFFDPPKEIRDGMGCALMVAEVRPSDTGTQRIQQLLELDSSPVEASCKIQFTFEYGHNICKTLRFTSRNEYRFILSAGKPKSLGVRPSDLEQKGLEFEHHGRIPEFSVFAKDKFDYPVVLQYGEKYVIKATLVYVGDDVERRDARENAFEFSSTLSGASVTLGGNPISFAPHSPQVTDDEIHELRLSARPKTDGQSHRKEDLRGTNLSVVIRPSARPCSARPTLNGSDDVPKDSQGRYVIHAEAGSTFSGIYFKFYDEADREVPISNGYSMKCSLAPKFVKIGEDSLLPPIRCNEKAGQAKDVLVEFQGRTSDGGAEPKVFVVKLAFISYPSAPNHWSFCNPQTGEKLDSTMEIFCNEKLDDIIGFQLQDRFNNSVDPDIEQCRDIDTLKMLRAPKVTVGGLEGSAIDRAKVFEKEGDWKTFIPSKGGRDGRFILRLLPECVLRNCVGEWQFTIRTDPEIETSHKMAPATQKFYMKPGYPMYIQVAFSGLPFDDFNGEEEERIYSRFASASGWSGELPSTCVIKKVGVTLLDIFGNQVDHKSKVGMVTKKSTMTVQLPVGHVAEHTKGKLTGMEQEAVKAFNSNSLTFKDFRVSAGKDGNGELVAEGKLIFKSSISHVQELVIPVRFLKQNKVEAIVLSPDPYTPRFCVGEKLNKIVIKVSMEDGAPLDLSNDDRSFTVNCLSLANGQQLLGVLERVLPEEGRHAALDADPNGRNIFFCMPGENVLQVIGECTIQVKYKETRPSKIGHLGGYEITSNTLKFLVLPGIPHFLIGRAEMTVALQNPKKACVASNGQTHESTRKILKNPLTLQVRDQANNICDATSDLCVVASIHPDDDHNCLQDCEDTYDIYHMARFEFTDNKRIDEEQMAQKALYDKMKEANTRHKESQKSLQQKKVEVERMELDGESAERKRQDVQEYLKRGGFRPESYSSSGMCSQTIDNLEQGRAQSYRKAKVSSNVRMAADRAMAQYEGVLGLVVDLIYVEDLEVAEILGIKCKNALETLVVRDKWTLDEVSKHPELTRVLIQVVSFETVSRHNQRLMEKDGKKQFVLHYFKNMTEDHRWLTDYAIVNLVEIKLVHMNAALRGPQLSAPDSSSFREADLAHRGGEDERLLDVLYALFGNSCVVPMPFEQITRKFAVARSHNVRLPQVTQQRDGRSMRMGIASGALSLNWQKTLVTVPGQKDSTGSKIQALKECKQAFDACEVYHERLKPAAKDKEEMERQVNELEEIYNDARMEYYQQKARRLFGYGAGGSLEGGESQSGENLPELDIIGAHHTPPGGAVAKLGRFVFDVDASGSAVLSNLGLKAGVGNKVGAYKLKCSLHRKSTGELVSRSRPDVAPPIEDLTNY